MLRVPDHAREFAVGRGLVRRLFVWLMAPSILAAGSAGLAWRATLNGFEDSDDRARALAVDAAGDVIVAGPVTAPGASPTSDLSVVKLDGISGDELWRTQIDGPVGSYDHASGVAVDTAGDVVVTGFLCADLTAGPDGCQLPDSRFTAVKLGGGTGTEIWRLFLDEVPPSNPPGASPAAPMAAVSASTNLVIDALGNVVAANPTDGDLAVVKVEGATGLEIWTGRLFSDFGQAFSTSVDSAGDVVTSGYVTTAATLNDFAVLKVAGDSGAELWNVVIDGAASGHDVSTSVLVDGAGDVIAAGSLQNSIGAPDRDFTVVKLAAATGSELWRVSLAGGRARALAVDAAGDIVAAGDLYGDLAIVKLDGTSGEELWRRLVGGSEAASDEGVAALALDALGDVVATGSLRNVDTDVDFAAVKLSGATGSELWSADVGMGDMDEAVAVAMDPTGDVMSAGFAYLRKEDSFDMSVLKLYGDDGAVVLPVPDADVSHTSMEFGDVPTGFPKTQTMVIRNLGDADLTADSVILTSGGTAGFQLEATPPPPAVLPRNGRLEVAVTFVADTAGGYADDLEIETDDPEVPFVTVPISGTGLPVCDDGVDNDGDGAIDWNGASAEEPADPGCADAGDSSEKDQSGTYPCDDGLDNDGDGRADFDPDTHASPGDQATPPEGTGDPGCQGPSSPAESPQCQDGADNEGDGMMDYDAGFSANGVADPNGADPECVGRPWKDRETKPSCGLGAELTLLLLVPIWLSRRRGR